MAGTAGQEDAVLEARTAVASALALAAERGIAEGDDTRCDPLQQLARVRFFAWSICVQKSRNQTRACSTSHPANQHRSFLILPPSRKGSICLQPSRTCPSPSRHFPVPGRHLSEHVPTNFILLACVHWHWHQVVMERYGPQHMGSEVMYTFNAGSSCPLENWFSFVKCCVRARARVCPRAPCVRALECPGYCHVIRR